MDGTPASCCCGGETSTASWTMSMRWEKAETLIYKNSVTDFFTADSIFAKHDSITHAGFILPCRIFIPFPRKSLLFLTPCAPSTDLKAGGEQLYPGPWAPALTVPVSPTHHTFLPGHWFFCPFCGSTAHGTPVLAGQAVDITLVNFFFSPAGIPKTLSNFSVNHPDLRVLRQE